MAVVLVHLRLRLPVSMDIIRVVKATPPASQVHLVPQLLNRHIHSPILRRIKARTIADIPANTRLFPQQRVEGLGKAMNEERLNPKGMDANAVYPPNGTTTRATSTQIEAMRASMGPLPDGLLLRSNEKAGFFLCPVRYFILPFSSLLVFRIIARLVCGATLPSLTK